MSADDCELKRAQLQCHMCSTAAAACVCLREGDKQIQQQNKGNNIYKPQAGASKCRARTHQSTGARYQSASLISLISRLHLILSVSSLWCDCVKSVGYRAQRKLKIDIPRCWQNKRLWILED